MSEIKHRKIQANGIWMHIAEKGKEGDETVLLIHGFPELWSSWIHQINGLASYGYRVVAPDMRSYGDTDCPQDSSAYTLFHTVGDLVSLLDQLGLHQVYVVGHDWGAVVAWHLCLFRPDRIKALVNLGLPYRQRSPNIKPSNYMSIKYGEGFYISQFQEAGRAEKSFSKYDVVTVLKKFLLINCPDNLAAPPGVEIIDFLETPDEFPPWITEQELQLAATKFEVTGFTGALNYYRAMDVNWELLGAWQGAKIKVPTKLIVGDKDLGFESFGTKDYINGEELKNLVPDLQVVVIDGHHYIQLERAHQVTQEILSFFSNN